ncbi:hypothetical protein ACJIZ3_012294 [Penstemon smallii]|uniref:RING-type domain-containing protein n=1 Tax=Penstemon smallii TaxID=265156 RepID=A0ABD3ULL7_9LAMI
MESGDSHNHSAAGRNNLSGLTLNAVLSNKRGQQTGPADEPLQRVQSNRTLLDIIREEPGGSAYKDGGKRSWRHFKDKLRLRRTGSGSNWTSSVRVPTSDVPINNNNNNNRMMAMNRRPSTRFGDPPQSNQPPSLERNSSRALERASGRFEHTSSLAMRRLNRERDNDEDDEEEKEEDEEEDEEGEGIGDEDEDEDEEGGEHPVRMSLMSLLAETDREMGLDSFMMGEEEEEEDEDEEEEVSAVGGEYNNCCVCMVRHKGAAFIPCGHTFCRLCSRELWVQRGNCPLCNNYILEILDIF